MFGMPAAGLGFIFVDVPALVVGLVSTISATKRLSRVCRCIDAKERQRSREEHDQRGHDEGKLRSEAPSRERMQVREQVRTLTAAPLPLLAQATARPREPRVNEPSGRTGRHLEVVP